MNIKEFKDALRDKKVTGTRVRYIPHHAHGDAGHPSCEDGAISTIGEEYVFVRFDRQVVKKGGEASNAEACEAENLKVL